MPDLSSSRSDASLHENCRYAEEFLLRDEVLGEESSWLELDVNGGATTMRI